MAESVRLNELDDYLRGQHLVEKAEIEEIEALVLEALPVFLRAWDDAGKAWPYSVTNGGTRSKTTYSQSTSAMICFGSA